MPMVESLGHEPAPGCRGPLLQSRPMADPTNPRAIQSRTENEGGEATPWRRWLLYAAIAVLAIVALQNSQTVEVKFLTINGSAPLIVVLLFAALLGAAIGYAAPVLRRHRRDERRRDAD